MISIVFKEKTEAIVRILLFFGKNVLLNVLFYKNVNINCLNVWIML